MMVYQGGSNQLKSNGYGYASTQDPYYLWDAANVRSWGGVGPNLVGEIAAAWSPWPAGTLGKSELYTSPRGGNGVYVRFDYNNGGGASYYGTNIVACSPDTWYTITAYMKYMGDTPPSANLLYVYQYNSGSVVVAENGYYDSTRQMSVGDGWYLVWGKFKTVSTATQFTLRGFNYAPIQVWVERPQIKRSGLSNAINYDLAGNVNSNTSGPIGRGSLIETNNSGSIEYNPSAASISLRSTDSFIPIHSGYETWPAGTPYTIIAASRYRNYGTGTPAYGRIITSTLEFGTNWLLGHHLGTVLNYYANGWVNNDGEAGDTIDTNWRVYAGSFDQFRNEYRFYVNGELYANNSGGADSGIWFLGINALTTQGSDCEFGYLGLWNTALSDIEIQRKSKELMARYNI